jgi:HlyD family secretion protein
MKRILNIILLFLVAAVVVGLLTMWLRPTPTRVDVGAVSRDAMTVTVDGEGKTRVRDRYVVACTQSPGACDAFCFAAVMR